MCEIFNCGFLFTKKVATENNMIRDIELIQRNFLSSAKYDKKIFLVRHGERLDMVKANWRNNAGYPDDPPLTEYGMKQANITGERLEKENIEYIYCSPFLRTVQTAHEIAKVLNVKIRIEYGLHEALIEGHFHKRPKIRTPEELFYEFRMSTIDIDYKSNFEIKYPEKPGGIYSRSLEVLRHIDRLHPGANILIVSHILPISYMAESLCALQTNYKYVKYCCLTECIKYENKWKFGAFMDDEHLKYIESWRKTNIKLSNHGKLCHR